jgi:uncharacterized protein (TIGR03083 family)
MGARVLRQHYDGVETRVDPALTAIGEPWLRHRDRFVSSVRELTPAQWAAPTRCTEWDAKDVVAHLITADQFWVLTLGGARTGTDPTKHLVGFDPSTSVGPIIEPLRAMSTAEIADRFVATTDALAAEVETFGDDDWGGICESPFGHIEARFVLGHAFWDSWLHERDVFVPLGVEPPVEHDELLAATWFTFFVAGVQGGLLDDPEPVGAGLDTAVDVTVTFDDLPDTALRVRYDQGVHLELTDAGDDALPVGAALDLVERFAGRRPPAFDAIADAGLAAQLERASQIL